MSPEASALWGRGCSILPGKQECAVTKNEADGGAGDPECVRVGLVIFHWLHNGSLCISHLQVLGFLQVGWQKDEMLRCLTHGYYYKSWTCCMKMIMDKGLLA